MTTLLATLQARFSKALATVYDLSDADALLRPSDHADLQSNVAMSLRKRIPDNPRDAATKLIAALELEDLCEKVELSGPGFINLQLRADFVARCAEAQAADEHLGVRLAGSTETIVIDYSSPNIAKELHVGHLRSTIIGDALARTLEALGHRVVRQNHLGDWGTPFGMLIEHLLDLGEESAGKDMADLNAFYKAARAKFDQNPDFADRARQRVVMLQAGDAVTLAHWNRLVDESKKSFQAVYELLGITMKPEDAAGESLFNSRLGPTIDELQGKGLVVESDGALCVFPKGFSGKDKSPLPLIVRKKDGGYGYATTDLAAIKYRLQELGATRILYVVGAPQAQHLHMIFTEAKEAGWLAPPARAEHVAFGSVLGEDNKPFKTRDGETVRLVDLIAEAQAHALELVKAKASERAERAGGEDPLDDEEIGRVARAVGVAAIKYADLCADRQKDYVFSFPRMLATVGNTGPYMQYAHARTRSILRKAEASGAAPGALRLQEPAEKALALSLLSFGAVVSDVGSSLEPHRLCTYLFQLATAFNTFWEKCPVLRSDIEPATRASRIALVDHTARVLHAALGLLGIEAPARM